MTTTTRSSPDTCSSTRVRWVIQQDPDFIDAVVELQRVALVRGLEELADRWPELTPSLLPEFADVLGDFWWEYRDAMRSVIARLDETGRNLQHQMSEYRPVGEWVAAIAGLCGLVSLMLGYAHDALAE